MTTADDDCHSAPTPDNNEEFATTKREGFRAANIRAALARGVAAIASTTAAFGASTRNALNLFKSSSSSSSSSSSKKKKKKKKTKHVTSTTIYAARSAAPPPALDGRQLSPVVSTLLLQTSTASDCREFEEWQEIVVEPPNQEEELVSRAMVKMINVDRCRGVDLKLMYGEAAVLTRLDHPNIARYLTSFERGGKFFIITECVVGGHMGSQIGKPHDARTLRLWGRQIFDALAYMHRRNVLHRDLEPESILLDVARAAIKIAHPMMVIAETGLYEAADDMWSVGCVLGALLARTSLGHRRSFYDDAAAAAIEDVCTRSFKADRLLGAVVGDLLNSAPALRPSAADVLLRLDNGEEKKARNELLPSERFVDSCKMTWRCILENLESNDVTKLDLARDGSVFSTPRVLYNQIQDEGAARLAAALEKNASLQTLGLWFNQIGDDGAESLGASLEKNASLTELNLRDNKLSEKAERQLRAVAKKTPARKIYL
ncbi:hypothetical protein CTAYLR_000531 [Chrysophaeum taylorii]|uniref:non-specific serine/threonine protein kinase n=1 Tax=Chrysophaeum taylorii TaxID=2483200 RepID=A0AAD7UGU2_9STRA|nr:hypothetical protein CTAYLR_000531 [Chrysophaeum taylorii]